MSPPDLLTEADFLLHEFPAPANPYRPLVVVVPEPDEDTAQVAQVVQDIAHNGYGGLVLDPAAFGPAFLGEAWFGLVGQYVEACRLLGLYLWLLDGFTVGAPLAAMLDEAAPNWRGQEITIQSVTAQEATRLEMTLAGPPSSRLLGLLALPLHAAQPLNLLTRLDGCHLQWDPPPGVWEVISFWANRAHCLSPASFNWADRAAVVSWFSVGFSPYREFLGSHFGRTLRGFLIACPTRPWPRKAGEETAWPLLTSSDPAWLDLAALVGARVVRPEGTPYPRQVTEIVNQSYLAPLHDWCRRHRLRLAGYRLSGSPLLGMLDNLDLGGLPDLTPGRAPNEEELAALAGLARYRRQEKVVCQLPLTGAMREDRATIGRLAAAGADLFLVRKRPVFSPGGELAITDYAARLAMAISAGGPAREAVAAIAEEPEALRAAGRQALIHSRKGVGVAYFPCGDCGAGDEVSATAEDTIPMDETIGGGSVRETAVRLPEHLSLCTRKVENWTACTVFNLSDGRWCGPVDLPAPGAAEVWLPASGERRPIAALSTTPNLRVPLALEPGEAVLVVIRRPASSRFPARTQLVQAHLTLGRNWEFEAPGGNVLPLDWQDQGAGSSVASFTVLSIPGDVHLAEVPPTSRVWLNGRPLPEVGPAIPLSGRLIVGENRLEMSGVWPIPSARIRGRFVCRGKAIAEAPWEMAGPWTQNGYPFFAGPGLYRQTVHVPADLVRDDLEAWLEVKALAESAIVRLNGMPVGFLPWPPYRLHLGLATNLLIGDNSLELEVHAPASKAPWAFKGLLGEVSVLFGEATMNEL